MSPLQRPNFRFVELYSRVGQPERARPYLAAAESLPNAQTPDGQRGLAALRGFIARAEQRHDDAIAEMRRAIGGSCPDCGLPDLAMTYDMAGQVDSAIAIYTRFTQGRAIGMDVRAGWLPLTHRRLGELHDAKGDVDQALSHYAQFVDLWSGADAELQPQVQKARDRMRELQRRRG
jgi:hypothetical protein